MLSKDRLRKEFADDWKKHYQVSLFRERGFVRKSCPRCGKHFWTLDSERKTCGDSSCEPYSFIGQTVTRKSWDYVETWKLFEKYFKKEGHASIPRYPVIDRWRPDLFFTIASIQDFQRLDKGNMVFVYPENPLIVPQVCLRFPDIPSVGVSGRHLTSFIMPGQHAFGHPKEGYFKDRCMELDFGFLTGKMGIPEEELVYGEDIWSMPDFSAFGPCIEAFSRGLELVNHVFMQFQKSGNSYRPLETLVNDTGWGHERLVWFSNGEETMYDSTFGPVMKWMRRSTGFKPGKLFPEYARLAGTLDMDEARDARKLRENIANSIGVSVSTLKEEIEPMQALYAAADHTRTLLFAITDGGIPSNVGGGYNLRVILRRMISMLEEHGLDIDPVEAASRHAKFLKPLFPELRTGLETYEDIMGIEKERFRTTMRKARMIVSRELKRGMGTESLARLYRSNGITPELVEKVADEEGVQFSVPDGFYKTLTGGHMTKETEKDRIKVDVSSIPPTKMLFYEKPYQTSFRSRILDSVGEWMILEKTLFYAEGGGQPSDRGVITHDKKSYKVLEAQKIGDVILHKLDRPGPKQGWAEGEIDWDRRHLLMKMHTATHVVAGSARNVLGSHIWQAGAQKGMLTSRIDLTHYRPFTREEIEQIESQANRVIKKGLPVSAEFMPREEAEKRYGFVLYQGGASPGKTVRVVSVKGLDVEACAGTHLANTNEIGRIRIVRSERIQDGVNRLEFTAGEAADEFSKQESGLYEDALEAIRDLHPFKHSHFRPGDAREEIEGCCDVLSTEPSMLVQSIRKFVKEIAADHAALADARESAGLDSRPLENEPVIESGIKDVMDLPSACSLMFRYWKVQKKALEDMERRAAKAAADSVFEKRTGKELYEIVNAEPGQLVELAEQLLDKDPSMRVCLANQSGHVVGMSRTEEMGPVVKQLCQEAGGSGGGKRGMAQGKAELSKLVKVFEHRKRKASKE